MSCSLAIATGVIVVDATFRKSVDAIKWSSLKVDEPCLIDADNADDRYALGNEELILGRRATCGIQILDANVSGEHCGIVRFGEQFFVRDLKSTNGTFINGMEVRTLTPINNGDSLAIGDSREFRFFSGQGADNQTASRWHRYVSHAFPIAKSARLVESGDVPMERAVRVAHSLERFLSLLLRSMLAGLCHKAADGLDDSKRAAQIRESLSKHPLTVGPHLENCLSLAFHLNGREIPFVDKVCQTLLDKKVKPSDTYHSLSKLVSLRNRVVHDGEIAEGFEDLFFLMLDDFVWMSHFRLCTVGGLRMVDASEWRWNIVDHSGPDPLFPKKTIKRDHPVPDGTYWLEIDSTRELCLSPFIAARATKEDGALELVYAGDLRFPDGNATYQSFFGTEKSSMALSERETEALSPLSTASFFSPPDDDDVTELRAPGIGAEDFGD